MVQTCLVANKATERSFRPNSHFRSKPPLNNLMHVIHVLYANYMMAVGNPHLNEQNVQTQISC